MQTIYLAIIVALAYSIAGCESQKKPATPAPEKRAARVALKCEGSVMTITDGKRRDNRESRLYIIDPEQNEVGIWNPATGDPESICAGWKDCEIKFHPAAIEAGAPSDSNNQRMEFFVSRQGRRLLHNRIYSFKAEVFVNDGCVFVQPPSYDASKSRF